MGNLIGVEIDVSGTRKFVGKVGECPQTPIVPWLAGFRIFYREVPWRDLYCETARAISCDRAAWDLAVKLGAKAMLCWCPDRKTLLYCKAADVAASPVVDLGERPQYRISQYRSVEPAGPVKIGFTNITRLAGEPARNDAPDPFIGSLFSREGLV